MLICKWCCADTVPKPPERMRNCGSEWSAREVKCFSAWWIASAHKLQRYQKRLKTFSLTMHQHYFYWIINASRNRGCLLRHYLSTNNQQTNTKNSNIAAPLKWWAKCIIWLQLAHFTTDDLRWMDVWAVLGARLFRETTRLTVFRCFQLIPRQAHEKRSN